MPKPGLSLPSWAQPPLWPGEVWGQRRGEFGGWVWGSRGLLFWFSGGYFLGGGDQGGSLVCPWRNREGEAFLSTG